MNWPGKWSQLAGTGLLPGALAGLMGGLVFGVTRWEAGQLSLVAQMARNDSGAVGFVLILAVSVIIGAGFGVLERYQAPRAGETLFLGIVYGTFWWFLGPLTLLPILRGEGLTWDLVLAQQEFSSLLSHVLYGATLGLALVFLQRRRQEHYGTLRIRGVVLFRGAVAGLAAAGLLGAALNAQDQLQPYVTVLAGNSLAGAWLVTLTIGMVAGAGFAVFYPNPTESAGADLIRGVAYGFFWWVVGVLTLVPLLGGAGLTWSQEEVRAVFPTLPGFLLFGAAVALMYQWMDDLVALLFSDRPAGSDDEGLGTQGLRIVGRSILAGLVGGLLFSLIMYQIGFLKYVADLIGSNSTVTGFFVHLVISILVGTSYGLLFRRQSYDLGSALGWGVSYGFFWAILGPITLMPIFLGSSPQWTVSGVASAFPNLIGHLIFGAGMGITFYFLEVRYSPWWVLRTQVQADRVARRRAQVLTSAPALWTLLIVIGLILPVLIAR